MSSTRISIRQTLSGIWRRIKSSLSTSASPPNCHAKIRKRAILPTVVERILFIDDEKSIVDMAKQILGRLGYHVETKTDPVEAIAPFRSDPDRCDLVITDMTMPNMTGDRLVREMMGIR